MMPPRSDKLALQPIPDNPRAAVVERLFREHNEALLRFLRARVGSQNEALEVAQEAYVRLLSLDQPGAVSYLRAFLFGTAATAVTTKSLAAGSCSWSSLKTAPLSAWSLASRRCATSVT